MGIHIKNWTSKNGKNRRIRLYGVWMGMKTRCFIESHNYYHRYGGRGITVCRDWMSFDSFREWSLQNGYRKGLTLDRIDNDGNYESSNCRWTTWQVQNSNKRCNRIPVLFQNAIRICMSKDSLRGTMGTFGISHTTYYRIRNGIWFLPPNSVLPRKGDRL